MSKKKKGEKTEDSDLSVRVRKILAEKNKLYAVFAVIIILIAVSLIVGVKIFEFYDNPVKTVDADLNLIKEEYETETSLDVAVPVWIEIQTYEPIDFGERIEIETVEQTAATELIYITETESETIQIDHPTTESPVTVTEPINEPVIEVPAEEPKIKRLVLREPDPPPPPPTTVQETSAPTSESISTPVPEPAPAPVPKIVNDGVEKYIALTFDDGPTQYTERLLDILAENDSAATFFVVGFKVASYKDIILRMVEQGSEVAGHSWNHPNFAKSSGELIRQELQSTNNAIYNVTGILPTIYRPPYGSYNDTVKNISKELGLAIINWNLDPRDWQVRNADTVYNNIMSKAKNGAIVVLHDTHKTTVDAMERVIPDLIEAGYKIVTVSELLQSTEPGTVYLGG